LALKAPRAVSRRCAIRARPPCRFHRQRLPAVRQGERASPTPSPPCRRSCTIRRPTRWNRWRAYRHCTVARMSRSPRRNDSKYARW